MTVDNRVNTGKMKMAFILTGSLSLMMFAYSIFEGIEKNLFVFVIAILLVFVYIFMLILKLHYFYCNDDKNSILIRFYNSHPIFRKYKAIEIQKSSFVDYDITESLFGLIKELTITVNTKNGKIDYPSLSISLLSKKEITALKGILDSVKN